MQLRCYVLFPWSGAGVPVGGGATDDDDGNSTVVSAAVSVLAGSNKTAQGKPNACHFRGIQFVSCMHGQLAE
jgi:hypothetical protein